MQRATAEQLPFGDGAFDAALAQLVVHFMTDPVAGLREMERVTPQAGRWPRASGITPANAPAAVFWQAARELDPEVRDESHLAGAREGHLSELFADAGLAAIEETSIEATVRFETFDEWWEPFTLGVGPAGAYAKSATKHAGAAARPL